MLSAIIVFLGIDDTPCSIPAMFIRRTKTRTVGTQDHYFTFRLKSVRLGDKVRHVVE